MFPPAHAAVAVPRVAQGTANCFLRHRS